MVPVPFAASNTCDVQAECGQGAHHNDARNGEHPFAYVWGKDDGQRGRPEVEGQLDGDARNDDMGSATDRE
jgi:hypothetical protein